MTAMPRDEMPAFLDKLDHYDGNPQTAFALRLLVLTFVRTTELIGARWQEIDFDKAEWRIPAERMKMREEHVVPLSEQVIALLHELYELTGATPMLFPSRSNAHKPMSNKAISVVANSAGFGAPFRRTERNGGVRPVTAAAVIQRLTDTGTRPSAEGDRRNEGNGPESADG